MADSAAMFGPPLFWARVSPGLPSVAAACSRVPKSGQGLPFTPRAALRRASLWPEASPWPEHFRFNGIVGLRARTGPTRDGVPGPRYLGVREETPAEELELGVSALEPESWGPRDPGLHFPDEKTVLQMLSDLLKEPQSLRIGVQATTLSACHWV